MERLLFIDTETGGLNPQKHSLLSIGVVIWDKYDGIIYKKNMCPITKHYSITPEAYAVNHFNPNDYNKNEFYSSSQIYTEFVKIKNAYFPNYTKIPLAGHNIQFDDSFLRVLFKKIRVDYESLFSYRLVDTYSILKYLVHIEKLPADISNSTKAFEYFGITIENRHTALGDAEATAILYSMLLELGNS